MVRWCEPAKPTDDAFRLEAIQACKDWGLHVVRLGPAEMDIDYLWVLKKLLERYPEPELEAFVGSFEPRFQEGRGALVFPDAPKRWLPKDPGEGLDRFRHFVGAATGRPATRAARFLEEFTRTPGEGYVLTHQFLALQWAEETGLALAPEVSERRSTLLRRIREEHEADPIPRDLDFERSMILLLYGEPDPASERGWIERMLGAWDASARRWTYDNVAEIRFGGRFYRYRYGPDHPTAAALAAVREYLGRSRAAERQGASS